MREKIRWKMYTLFKRPFPLIRVKFEKKNINLYHFLYTVNPQYNLRLIYSLQNPPKQECWIYHLRLPVHVCKLKILNAVRGIRLCGLANQFEIHSIQSPSVHQGALCPLSKRLIKEKKKYNTSNKYSKKKRRRYLLQRKFSCKIF